MTHEELEPGHPLNAVRPVEVIAQRVRRLREQRGWTAKELAERMTSAGVKWERSVVANLESGRRQSVSVDELLALAYVLDVAPVHLLVPLSDNVWFHFTPETATPAGLVREWVRGRHPLRSTNARLFFSEVPDHEWEPPKMSDEEIERRSRLVEVTRQQRPKKGGDGGEG